MTDLEREILAVIARGHPSRNMTVTSRGVSRQVSVLTWNEIEVGVGKPSTQIWDAIAKLGMKGYIDSGPQLPSIWGFLGGKKATNYWWTTATGRSVLEVSKGRLDSNSEGLKSNLGDLKAVEKYLHELGYKITDYGTGVALLTLESGYSHVETASHLALVTLAQDAKDANFNIMKLLELAAHAAAMMQFLAKWKEAGLIRDERCSNDAEAMVNVAKGDPSWIAAVLKDPIATKDRVANTWLKYNKR